ncbi:hypothetical protein TNCV_3628221 [Trichonephila clavipes]|nr:hypothetical protein TNCV_3628221 [Trichonephila clavipes]
MPSSSLDHGLELRDLSPIEPELPFRTIPGMSRILPAVPDIRAGKSSAERTGRKRTSQLAKKPVSCNLLFTLVKLV